MVQNKTSYSSLSAEFYDLDPTYPPEKEVAFLSPFIEHSVPGPWLEAMSGSGRILIPLLQKGFVVEGVDNSPHMLARCKERLNKINRDVPIYDQSVTELSLPKKYSGIIICFASWQLLPDRAQAIKALQLLKDHLLPGGMILIDIFVPWESIKRCIVNGTLMRHMRIENAPVQIVQGPDFSIERRATIDVLPYEQYTVVCNSYAKKDSQGIVIATEEEEMFFLWYHRYEMVLLLEQVGFKTVNIFHQNDEMITYQAIL